MIEELLMKRKEDALPPPICNEIKAYIYGNDPYKPITLKIVYSAHKGMHLLKNKGLIEVVVYGYDKPEDIVKAAKQQKNANVQLKALSGKLDKNVYLCQHPNNVIYDGCTLHVRRAIYVKTLTKKTVTIFDVDFSKTIRSQICQRVQDELGIAIDSQRIIFAGKLLEKDKSVSACNLSMNCTLHLVVRIARK